MLQLLNKSIDHIFFENIRSCDKNILLCAPYIKNDIVKKIIKEKNENVNLQVITTSSLASFIHGASDIDAIEELIETGAQVINCQHLHAKIYIFDKEKAIITSANLTYNGLNRNFEYGVMIDDKLIVSDIDDDCYCLISDELSGEFDLDTINDIKKQISIINKTNYKIITDEFCDEKIQINPMEISKTLNGWIKDVFDVIAFKMKDIFSLKDLYLFESEFKKLHPNNSNIRPKVRQTLQYLRDRGLIKFVDLGLYKKLFKE